MLLSGFNFRGHTSEDFDDIHNHYESLVLDELRKVLANKDVDKEYIADVACVALNNLPARYIRHDVDMMFYLSSKERTEMQKQVTQAVAEAISYVDERSKHKQS